MYPSHGQTFCFVGMSPNANPTLAMALCSWCRHTNERVYSSTVVTARYVLFLLLLLLLFGIIPTLTHRSSPDSVVMGLEIGSNNSGAQEEKSTPTRQNKHTLEVLVTQNCCLRA